MVAGGKTKDVGDVVAVHSCKMLRSKCSLGSWNIRRTWVYMCVSACECNPIGSVGTVCNLDSGQCDCRSNYASRDCSACADGYFGYPTCECEYTTHSLYCKTFSDMRKGLRQNLLSHVNLIAFVHAVVYFSL